VAGYFQIAAPAAERKSRSFAALPQRLGRAAQDDKSKTLSAQLELRPSESCAMPRPAPSESFGLPLTTDH